MTALPERLPPWDGRFSGRAAAELASLDAMADNVAVDLTAAAEGRLAIDFEWDLDGRKVRLRAAYPDDFPYFPAQVFLRERPFPLRHCDPVCGLLCLIGRNTRQAADLPTLGELLCAQLGPCLEGGGEEDPQGEPSEFWWNAFAHPGWYCLVDSSWSPGAHLSGMAKLAYEWRDLGASGQETFQATMVELRGGDGTVLASASPSRPSHRNHVLVPWMRAESPFDEALRQPAHPRSLMPPQLARHAQQMRLRNGRVAYASALAYPTELAHGISGTGWLFAVDHGAVDAFTQQRSRARVQPQCAFLKTFRAGSGDLETRIPAQARLHGRRVLLVGTGAIGAPVALSLARNRCSNLDLLDGDEVEPGNSARWPIGASGWGYPKVEALKELIDRDYPNTKVDARRLRLGEGRQAGSGNVADELERRVAGADIVVDAAASYAVTLLLADACRVSGRQLVTGSATSSMAGGFVALFRPGSGCPVCLERAWHRRRFPEPEGLWDECTLVQPAGCSERTFVGADYDLQVISSQIARCAVAALAEPGGTSLAFTVRLGGGLETGPTWRRDYLPRDAWCGCADGH